MTAEELIRRAMHPEQIEEDVTAGVKRTPGTDERGGAAGGRKKGRRHPQKSDTLAAYSAKVEKIRHYIREGHIFQTVLSQRWTVETGRDGFSLYKELRELNPSPYLYYFQFGNFEVIGSSPEMLVKQQGKRVFTCPIAGTRPRGKTVEEDEALHRELLADEKERAEHVMLVDLARNDMGRISESEQSKVTDFMNVRNYSHVMHIVSMVGGRKKGSYHPFDLLASFLPAGTLSGAPKIRAMEIIEELEEVRRGLYGGATGYVDFSGDMDFCITIRTMIKKGREVYLQAGAGIVADSVPEKEYRECCNKVMALARTLLDEETYDPLIDNYDSFTYNLYQYIGTFTPDIRVVRNDAITIGEIENMRPERIVLSPGPKSPKEAGICMDVVKHFYNKIPILGICLGHQCIGEAFG